MADHAFVMGLLRQRNELREKLCKSWPAHQFGVLCKRIKIQRFLPFKKVEAHLSLRMGLWASYFPVLWLRCFCAPITDL
jgi:hypothetical protein